MDTTYASIMLVAFLVLAALAINIGYLYVDEDDLRNMAEMSALKGAQDIKLRIMERVRTDPVKLEGVTSDTIQSAARTAAVDHASGNHKESALVQALNDNSNSLTTANDITVGFWNISTHAYTPGGKPVNAIQVRTRRTAESETVGIGNIGNILGIITGVQKFNFTPDAIAALPAKADANFAVCADACGSGCNFPNVCTIPERKMISDPWDPAMKTSAQDRYAYTSLTFAMSSSVKLSDMICMEIPPQEVCGREILTILDSKDNALRDMESMMYNPNVDASNKEYDRKTGELKGWWVIAPVTTCPAAHQGEVFEKRAVTRYALIRISRICMPGATGCSQNNTAFDAPATTCGGEKGLFIDRISCVNCGSKELQAFPGLHPVLVK